MLAGIDIGAVVLQMSILLLSISIHESAHAWSADRLGDPTARLQGRVTLNPIKHLDPVGSLLFPLLGILLGGIVFGWAKPVPVYTHNLKHPRRDHALVAAAGPASNLLLAFGFLVAYKTLALFVNPVGLGTDNPLGWLVNFLFFGVILNVVLAVFNLMPVPPLDGSWIISGLFPPLGRVVDLIRPYGFVILIVLLYQGVFDTVLDPVLGFVYSMIYSV